MTGWKKAAAALMLFGVCTAHSQQVTGARPRFNATVQPNLMKLMQAGALRYDGPVSLVYTKENAPATPKLDDLALAETVSQYGITWTFDRKARIGRFITGDWYVVGPVTVVKIDPKPLFGKEVVDAGWQLVNEGSVKEDRYKDQWCRNGSTLNQPVTTPLGGFDSRLSDGHYDPKQVAHLPISMKPGDALISTISAPEPIDHRGYGHPVMTAAVLTCLAEPVPADAFRPAYCDRQQKIYLARNLHRELLYSLPRTAHAPSSLTEWARWFQRPWLDTVSWGYASPELNMPRYGQSITHGSSHAALILHLDYPAVEKEQLLVHFVQYGIDLWGIVRAGSKGWMGHGGFGQGRKCAVIFAGILLGDDEMREPNRAYPNVVFGEDTQTSFGKSWTGHDVLFASHPAWIANTKPFKHPETFEPSKWKEVREQDRWCNAYQSDSYRRCCTSIEWPGECLAMRLMRAEKYWNHDPFFAYVDRWMEQEDIKATAKIVNEAMGSPGGWTERQEKTNAFFQEMWTTYRHNLPEPLQKK